MFRQAGRYNSFKNSGPRFTFQQYRKPIIYTGIGLGAFYLSNLEQAPVSHRWRFMIIPRWLELQIGESSYQQTLAQFRRNILPPSAPESRMVQKVMDRLIKVSGLDDVEWKVTVIGGDYPPNAFVLPGGKVFVFTSILPICKNEDGLAAVLGHELAHQVCRHTAENLSQSPIYLALAGIAYGITGSVSIERLMIQTLLKLPASRRMETEADYVGLTIMAKACFRPEEAVGLWQRMMQMEQKQGGSSPEFLSTHPASSRRIHDIKEHLPQADSIRSEYCSYGNELTNFFR